VGALFAAMQRGIALRAIAAEVDAVSELRRAVVAARRGNSWNAWAGVGRLRLWEDVDPADVGDLLADLAVPSDPCPCIPVVGICDLHPSGGAPWDRLKKSRAKRLNPKRLDLAPTITTSAVAPHAVEVAGGILRGDAPGTNRHWPAELQIHMYHKSSRRAP